MKAELSVESDKDSLYSYMNTRKIHENLNISSGKSSDRQYGRVSASYHCDIGDIVYTSHFVNISSKKMKYL